MYSERMKIRALASLAATASGIEDEKQREQFKQDFIQKAESDPDFIKKMLSEDRKRNLPDDEISSTPETS